MNIHPSAIIDPKAEIGADVEIGPSAVIEADVVIGEGCKIYSNAVLANGTKLANNVQIFPCAVIGSAPQDLKYAGEITTAEIGENTTVREFCTVNRGTAHSGRTIVGANCLLMAYSHVAHDCRLGNKVILANACNMGGHVHIGDWVVVGGMVAIHQFVRIGEHAMIGGKYRVAQDVPPYCLAGGWDLQYEGLNSIGLKRRGFNPEQRKAIKEAYRLIYQSDLLRTEALKKLKESDITSEVRKVVDFFENSERGVI